MKKNKTNHTFHIPVMGTGFTIDTPLKVAHYGINSVISLADDVLIERMREFYSNKLGLPFQAITEKIEDFRARRITEYLNMMDGVISEKYEKVRQSFQDMGEEWDKYVEMLPDLSGMKQDVQRLFKENTTVRKVQDWFKQNFHRGAIDVNVMTKLDREHYRGAEQLPVEYNDAHAAVRGFAKSNLESSIVFSAGMNPRLYNYLEKFDDFFPDETGYIRKKIILKVSDYRSAQIQGKYLAKKGLWVSEFRIESGLNCGGHAFATDGALMGPILEAFKENRASLKETMHGLLIRGLAKQNRTVPIAPLELKITAQGGVGSPEEHQFLLEYYGLDSVGWGTPFLLVPEAVNVDPDTLSRLSSAEEKDLHLSGISPLGVPFNSLRGNTRDLEKLARIANGDPGSACTRCILGFNKEYTDRGICTASKRYQKQKLKELYSQNLPQDVLERELEKVLDKSCICVGLGTSALLVNGLDTSLEGEGVSVCPGPNMAYFSGTHSLKEMVDYIYGRISGLARKDRPSMFATELRMYVEYLKDRITEIQKPIADKQREYLLAFETNLEEGIKYYRELSQRLKTKMQDGLAGLKKELEALELELMGLRGKLAG